MKRVNLISKAGFVVCMFSTLLGITSCSSDEANQIDVNDSKSEVNSRSSSLLIQDEITEFENSYIAQFAPNNENEIALFGYKT